CPACGIAAATATASQPRRMRALRRTGRSERKICVMTCSLYPRFVSKQWSPATARGTKVAGSRRSGPDALTGFADEDLALAGMVGGADDPFVFHALDNRRGAIIAYRQP